MTWNHRVVKHVNPHPLDEDEKYYYQIHEVYYNADGSIWSMTKEPIAPYGNSLEELQETLTWMKRALGKPVLDADMKFSDADFDKELSIQEELFIDMKLTHKRYHRLGGTIVVSKWDNNVIEIIVTHSGNMGTSINEVKENCKKLFDDVDIFEMLPACEGFIEESKDGSPDYYYTHKFLFHR